MPRPPFGFHGNDYSFNATDTAYTASPLVTVYVNGQLVWGTEPG